MPDQIRCPKCGQLLTQVGQFWICSQHGQVSLEKPFVPMRIFLSYGHDEHTSLARRLREDLNARGHQVWFDEERLSPGHDWESDIEKGLEWLAADKAHSAFVLLLTPHSVRRPDGYCLNEVARALSRGLRIIPLMVVESEPPLSICRIQWLDMRECIPIHEKEAFYRPRFERLLKAIEENQLDFEGVQQRLITALRPLEFDAEILLHVEKFMGRQWVFDSIQEWLRPPEPEASPKQRVFWISGGPGVGKTALSAVLSSRYLEVAAMHLCKFGHAQKSDPRRVVTSLAYQLSTQLPEYEARLAGMDVERLAQDDARTMFDNLLVQPLAKLSPPNRPIIILIDALDEATSGGRNELAGFIAAEFSKTPPWLRLVITGRPERAVTAPLQGLNPFVLDTATEANRTDIRDYLRYELSPLLQNRPDADRLVEQILEKSEGVFLYAERVCCDLRHGHLSLERLEQFPQGLGGVFWQFFERQFPDQERYRKDVRPALRAILAARELLPVEILQRLFRWQDEELRDFARTLGSLFPVSTQAGRDVIKPYHKSLTDWLADETKAGPYFASVKEGHRALAAACWSEYQRGVPMLSAYSLAHLPAHLVVAQRWEDLENLLTDLAYLEAKTAAGQVFGLVGDFVVAAAALPANRPRRRVLQLLEEALRRDIYFIARHAQDYPPALFQCLWNSCWWYDCAEAATHYVEPDGGWNVQNAPWLQPDEHKLCRLLERWREQRSAAEVGACRLHTHQPPAMQLGSAQRAVFRGHSGSVLSVAFSADGQRIATGSHDQTMRVWDASSGAELALMYGHPSSVHSVAFSPDGRRIVSGAARTLHVWDAIGGAHLSALTGHSHTVTALAFSPDGRHIAIASEGRTVWVCDAATGGKILALRGHQDAATSVAFSPDGRYIASGSKDRKVRIWDAVNGEELAVLRGHEGAVYDVAFSSDGGRIASASSDCTVRVWNAATHAQELALCGHQQTVRGVAFCPDGTRIASGAEDQTVRVWNAATGTELAVLHGHEQPVQAVAFSPNGQWVASGADDQTVRVWDVVNGHEQAVLRGHGLAITSVAFSCDGHQVATASRDHTVRMWDAVTGGERVVLRGHHRSVKTVVFSPDSRWVASGAADKTVRVWDTKCIVEPVVLCAHRDDVTAVAFSPDGTRIVSGSFDRTVRVWDARSGVVLAVLCGHDASIESVAYSLDAQRIVSGSSDKAVRLWDAETGECLEVIRGLEKVQAIASESASLPCWRAVARNQETVIEPFGGGEPVAWFPIALNHIVTHPSSYIWAGAAVNHLCIVTLEGDATLRTESDS